MNRVNVQGIKLMHRNSYITILYYYILLYTILLLTYITYTYITMHLYYLYYYTLTMKIQKEKLRNNPVHHCNERNKITRNTFEERDKGLP